MRLARPTPLQELRREKRERSMLDLAIVSIEQDVFQDWSLAARGCASRSFFVHLFYASMAFLMITWKLDDGLEDSEAVR